MPAPTVIASATEDEMIATFLRAEVHSSRFRTLLAQAVEQHRLTLDLVRFPDSRWTVQPTSRSPIWMSRGNPSSRGARGWCAGSCAESTESLAGGEQSIQPSTRFRVAVDLGTEVHFASKT